jgi:hypothetical protein
MSYPRQQNFPTMPHDSILACEVGHHQYWTTGDHCVFKTLNTCTGCKEDDINLRNIPGFKDWERAVEALLQTLHDGKIVLLTMPSSQAADDATIQRQLVAMFLKEYVEERAKRHHALDLLTSNGLSFDEAWSLLRPSN